ncbi:MAG: hypothetical protein LCH95_23445 [Proteobacteria bacterium]|nr:hypothetical protein [Pseudomonadota bacterium]
MPIHVRVSHPDRLVVAVAHGTITAQEFQDAVRAFLQQDALHYRKLIDVAAANTTADLSNLKTLLEMVRAAPRAAERGALAFVVDGKRGDLVRELATLNTEGERPVQVFTNLHEARRWLDSVTVPPSRP